GQDAVPTEFSPAANNAAASGIEGTSALDSLFGEDQFRDYELDPPPATTTGAPGDGDEPPKGISRTHITLMWVAGSAVALLALVAFFIVGTRLPFLTGSGTSASDEPTVPVETERPQGPVEPGTYNWNELLGGECLEGYRGAWENEYTVVDCSIPHDAQLVIRASVPVTAGTGGAYPGVSSLQSRMSLLCTDVTVVDYNAANRYDDVQFEASYPASVEEWDSGRRDYFCFISRSTGQPLEGSLAAPPVSEEPPLEDEGTTEESTEGDYPASSRSATLFTTSSGRYG
ncbi:MAG TPA: hypothetical protein PK890_09850, partial [Terrimesophilobacter sp.]|nr:hypothetical protein [Terrimesophilobacter sp.]